jgi:hypothetical protein
MRNFEWLPFSPFWSSSPVLQIVICYIFLSFTLTSSMQSGSYFTNLMYNDCTDPGEYDGTQSQNMEMLAYEGVV